MSETNGALRQLVLRNNSCVTVDGRVVDVGLDHDTLQIPVGELPLSEAALELLKNAGIPFLFQLVDRETLFRLRNEWDLLSNEHGDSLVEIYELVVRLGFSDEGLAKKTAEEVAYLRLLDRDLSQVIRSFAITLTKVQFDGLKKDGIKTVNEVAWIHLPWKKMTGFGEQSKTKLKAMLLAIGANGPRSNFSLYDARYKARRHAENRAYQEEKKMKLQEAGA